jgi:hypothetical protein
MPSKPQRITNGHRAAVCGLMLAGVPLMKASAIVGAPFESLKLYLPLDWRERISPRTKWTHAKLVALRKDYTNQQMVLLQVAIRHRTTVHMVQYLARREGWPYRPIGRPKGRGNRKRVAALVNAGVSRVAALQQVAA